MKKLAVLMVLVLCVVLLGGCMGSGAGSSVADAVAFIRIDAKDDIKLTVNKDEKVIAITYGVKDSSTVTKNETIYKDLQLLEKDLKTALKEVVKVNDETESIGIVVVSATGKEDDAVKSVKDKISVYLDEIFKANKSGIDVKIQFSLDGKSSTIVKEIKAADYDVVDGTSSEAK